MRPEVRDRRGRKAIKMEQVLEDTNEGQVGLPAGADSPEHLHEGAKHPDIWFWTNSLWGGGEGAEKKTEYI